MLMNCFISIRVVYHSVNLEMGTKQRLSFILSQFLVHLCLLALCPNSVSSLEKFNTTDENGSSELDDSPIASTSPASLPVTVLPVCSESALLSVHKVRHLKSNLGFFVNTDENYWQVPFYWVSSNITTNFSLYEYHLKCRGASKVALPIYKSEESINSSTKHFYPNGYFRYNRQIYAPDEYCIESFAQLSESDSSRLSSVQIKLCPPDCGIGKKRACIRKCCPLNQVFRAEPGKPFCTNLPPGSSQFMPRFYQDFYTEADVTKVTNDGVVATGRDFSQKFSGKSLPHFTINSPKSFRKNCKEKIYLPVPGSQFAARVLTQNFGNHYHSSRFRIRSDGALMYISAENKCGTIKSLGTICVDGLINKTWDDDVGSPFNNTEEEYILFQCQIAEKDPNMGKLLSTTLGGLLLGTSIFPLATCIVYIMLWKRQNVHGWSIAATSGSLFFMYVFYGSAHIIGITLKEEALNTFYCQLLAMLSHFFMMSAFTWMTVMSCDLWLTFRCVVPMNQRLHGVSRYLKYSAFGWGVPTVIVFIGILMDYVISASNDCSYHPVPAYGQQSCWIMEDALGEYLYYPAAFLVGVNILFFTATCVKLCIYGRGPTIRTRKNDAFGECFSRFAKLFCVMGVSWIFEILSWYIDGLGFFWYWFIFDIFNILRAVAVFAIYVCKKDVIKQLKDAYPALRSVCRPFGRLFFRKCSDETSNGTVESTAVYSAAPVSPCVPLRKGSTKIGRNKNRGNTLEVPD